MGESKIYKYDHDQYDSRLYISGNVDYDINKKLEPYKTKDSKYNVYIVGDDDGDEYENGYRWCVEIDNKFIGVKVNEILDKYGYMPS
jgi:hypothetical protein